MNVMDMLSGKLAPVEKGQMDNVEGILFDLCDACNSRKYCDMRLPINAEFCRPCCQPFAPVILSVTINKRGGRIWLGSFLVQ